MLVIKFYAGIVTETALNMACFQVSSGTGVAVAKGLLLKVILTMPVTTTPTHG